MWFARNENVKVCVGVVLSLALVTAPAFVAAADEAPAGQTLAEVESLIREVMVRTKTPGAGVAFVSRDGVLWQAGIGKADLATGRDATPDTLFRIGSISKMFVGLSALLLVERGDLALETPVRAIVPDVAFENAWEGTHPVRVVHLLEHTTGFDDMSLPEYAHSDPAPLPLRDALMLRPASRVSRWPPGTRMSYCNSGPAAAAYLIERITGRRFEDFVREHILAPLGMTTASYFAEERTAQLRATLYREDGVTPLPYWHILYRPSGAVNASAAEMARFLRMLVNRGSLDGVPLVTPSSLERMERPETTYAARAGLAVGYGLGNRATYAGGFLFHGHDGGIPGAVAKLEYLPQEGVGFVVLLNSASREALDGIAQICRTYLTANMARPVAPLAATLSPNVREALDGYWKVENPRQKAAGALFDLVGVANVDTDTDGFQMHVPFRSETDRYHAVGGRLFRSEKSSGPDAVLAETPEGDRLQMAGGASFRRVSTFVVWTERMALGFSLLLLASSPVFALVWIPRKILGRLGDVRHLGPRVWGLLAAGAFLGMHALVVLSLGDLFPRLGRPTVWSVGLYALSVAFAGATVAALYSSWRAPRHEQNGLACWYARAVAFGSLALVAWYAWFGLVGIRTWV